jgi:hypothetical protein
MELTRHTKFSKYEGRELQPKDVETTSSPEQLCLTSCRKFKANVNVSRQVAPAQRVTSSVAEQLKILEAKQPQKTRKENVIKDNQQHATTHGWCGIVCTHRAQEAGGLKQSNMNKMHKINKVSKMKQRDDRTVQTKQW